MNGRQFTEWMEDMGFTVDEAARSLGCTRNTVIRLRKCEEVDERTRLACIAIKHPRPGEVPKWMEKM